MNKGGKTQDVDRKKKKNLKTNKYRHKSKIAPDIKQFNQIQTITWFSFMAQVVLDFVHPDFREVVLIEGTSTIKENLRKVTVKAIH